MRAMISQPSVDTEPVKRLANLQTRLVDYASSIGELRTSDEVLEALHAIIAKSLPLCVLGAVRFPVNTAGWSENRLGKSVFLHKDFPDGCGKTMSLSRTENFLRFCSWLGRALLHSPGPKFNGCSNPSGLIAGITSWLLNTECATD